MGTNILNANILGDANTRDGGRDCGYRGSDGFAQVFPEHKFHIVDILAEARHIVGMTGDGVNDAPP